MKIRWKPNKIIAILIGGVLFFNCLTVSLQAENSERELFLVAQKAFEDGFYDVAIRYIRQLLNEYPQTEKRIESNLLLGQCYFFKNQYLIAYDIFQDLLKYSEYRDATLFWLGETYLKGSDYRQAVEQYRQLIELYPNSSYAAQAYYSLGWAYFEQDKLNQAKSIFLKFITNFPTHQLAEDAAFKLGETEYNLQSYENTIEYFRKYVINYPHSTRHAEAYFYTAESYYYLQNPLNAITYYAKAAEISYDNKLVFMSKVSLGWAYLKLSKYKLSQQYFDEALALAKEKNILTDDVYLGQGSLFSEMGEHEKALKAYKELIKKFPNSPRIAEAYLGEANIEYALGNFDTSIKTYNKIIDRYANAPVNEEILEKSYFGLAWSYLKAGNIDASIKSFYDIKEKTENKTVKISALTQVGDAYQDVGELQKAVDVYDQLLQNYPESIYTDYVQYRQGVALLKMGKIEAATLSFQSLQANFPDSRYLIEVQYYLAVAYFQKGDWINTRDHIRDFIKNASKTSEYLAETNFLLGLAHFNLEEHPQALKIFEKIIKNFPEHSEIIRKSELNIAKSYYNMGNVKESLKRFKLLTNKFPETTIAQEAFIWIGDHYLNSFDFNNAISYYQEFIDRFPGSDKVDIVRYQLGQAYQASERYDQAISILNEIDLKSDHELSAKAKLSIAGIFSKELDSASAMKTYQSIIATSPEFKRDAHFKLAEFYRSRKDYKKVIDEYTEALKSEKGKSQINNAQLHFSIADSYELINQSKEAIDEYFKIPYLYPNEKKWVVKAYLRVARIFEDNEQWDEAKNIYDKIIGLNADELKFAQERLEWIEENTVNQ